MSLRRKSGKVLEDGESKLLAFFRMKLEGVNIFVVDSRNKFDSIIRSGSNGGPIFGHNIVRVNEIKIRLIGNQIE
jgi:hypothetical protein